MEFVLLAVRVVLAAVFLVAGLAKLADLTGSREAMAEFGVPEGLAAPTGTLLPLVELGVGIALIPVASAWYGALAALVLLLLFVTGIGLNLARGNAPDCHCFGQLHSEPVGWGTLLRNCLLAALAAFVALQGRNNAGASVTSWLGNLSETGVLVLVLGLAGLIVLGFQSWFMLQLLRRHGQVLVRLDAVEAGLTSLGVAPGENYPAVGLPVGSAAPAFALPDLDDQSVTLDDLRVADRPVLLVFTDPHCGPCAALLPQVGEWQRQHASQLAIALISRGSADDNRAEAKEHDLANVLLQKGSEVADAYQAPGTPSAVLVYQDGVVGSAVALGADAIRALVARTLTFPGSQALPLLAQAPHAVPTPNGQTGTEGSTVPKLGEEAPAFQLSDLGGETRTETHFRGTPTIVLFWNTTCGFCQQMLPDLKAWDRKPPDDAPQLVVISTGPENDIKAAGLHATVLLDPYFTVGPRFGANGTPMAVLVDVEGRVASEVVAGASAVWALIGSVKVPVAAV